MLGVELGDAEVRVLSLREQAEAALTRSAFSLAFPAALEPRYRIDTGPDRSRELRIATWLGAALYVLVGLLVNAVIVLHPPWRSVAIQIVGTPLIMVLIARRYFTAQMASGPRDTALFLGCLVAGLAAVPVVYTEPPPVTTEDFLLTMLPLDYILICMRLRLPVAAAFLGICFVVLALAVLTRHDLTGHAQVFLLGFMAAFSLPALIGSYALESASRRVYLHALLDRLRNEFLAEENSALADLSLTDALTGVGNRRRLDAELTAFCEAGQTNGALLLIDIDHFKAFNDRHGHPAGDRCLQAVAKCLSLNLRRRDLVARFGGEEFAVVLADMTDGEALETANRLRKSVACQTLDVSGEPTTVTVSIGMAEAAGRASPALLVAAADAALYAAKRAGRDQVRVAGRERPGLERPSLQRT